MTSNNPENPFAGVVPQPADVPLNEPLLVLRQLAEALESATFAGVENARIAIAPGHTVNMGQQYKFCIQILEDVARMVVAYTDILFRFYVPATSYPVVVEFMGKGHRECADKKALTATLRELMENPNMRRRLSSLRTLAQDQLL